MAYDAYTVNLNLINTLVRKRGIRGLLAANDTLSTEHKYGQKLCKSISSPTNELTFRRYIHSGGQCIVLHAEERIISGSGGSEKCRDVAIKFALPTFSPAPAKSGRTTASEKKENLKKAQNAPVKSKIMRTTDYVKNVVKSQIKDKREERKRRRLEVQRIEEEKIKEKFATQESCRLERGTRLQKRAREKLNAKGLQGFGFIPQVYRYSPPTRQFIIEEWMVGENWLDWCKRKEDRDIITLFISLLNLLHEIHKLGIVHRDIKPNNLMVFPKTNTPILLDWGLAKAPGGEADVTTPEVVRGSPLYMDADAYNGEFILGKVTSDVFQAGSVLWSSIMRRQIDTQALTKERDEFRNIVWDMDEIRDFYDPDLLPQPLRNIFIKSTAKENERYQTAHEFSLALQECLAKNYDRRESSCAKPCKGLLELKSNVIELQEKVDLIISLLIGEKI